MIKEIISNAKINIGLNIEDVLENGYHILDMIMAPIDLADKLIVEYKEKKGKLKIISKDKNFPTNEENILYKVYNKFYELSKIEPEEIEVTVEKKIPMQAGLGGGSSNGAFFLKELNSYHENYFSENELIEFSKKIGADIPFFIINKTAHVKGVGEKLEIVQNNLKKNIIVVKPKFGVSTALAFKCYDDEKKELKNKKANIFKILEGLLENNLYNVETNIENQLEQGLLVGDVNIQTFRKELQMIKSRKFFMSGSGSAYYTFIDENEKQEYEKIKLNLKNCEVYLCKFL